MGYYEDVLGKLSKPNCAKMAIAFIKECYPDKPYELPYNGKEESRPAWWPPSVTHREPSRLRKAHCIDLLVHIICKPEISAATLTEVARVITVKVQPQSQLDIIHEVLHVRRMEILLGEERTRGAMVVSSGYCDDESGIDKTDDGAMPLNIGKAFNENLQIVPIAPREQAIMTIPTTTPYPLQDSFHPFGVQPENSPHEVPDSNFCPSSADQLGFNRGMPDRDALFGAVEDIVGWYTKVMGVSINRPLKTLAELYKYIIGTLDPTESQEISRQWKLAIQSDISHWAAIDWPHKKDDRDILFFILCGSHGLTLGMLNTVLQRSSVSPSTKRILKTIIVLRKYQLETIHQRKSESRVVSATAYHKRGCICGRCWKAFEKCHKLHEHSQSHAGQKPFRCSCPSCRRRTGFTTKEVIIQ